MTQDQLTAFAEKFFSDCIQLMKRKNADYANPKVHKTAFGNLSAGETFGIPTPVTILSKMVDKMSRLSSFVHTGDELQVKDESIRDTLIDHANYAMLMAAWIQFQIDIAEGKKQNTGLGYIAFKGPEAIGIKQIDPMGDTIVQ